MKNRHGCAGVGGMDGRMRKIMAVYDEDPAYAQRLADYVNQREKLPFTAMAFSSMERLQEYLKEHPAEIILAGERPAAELEALGIKNVMILSEAEVYGKRRRALQSISTSPDPGLCGRLWPLTAAVSRNRP